MEGQKSVFSVFISLLISQTTVTIMTVITTNTTSSDGLSPAPSSITYSTNPERWQSDTAAQGAQTSAEDLITPVPENSDVSARSSLSTPLGKSKSCLPFEQTLTGRNGTIVFTEPPDDCTKTYVWNIHVPSPDDGIVIKINNVSLRKWNSISVTSFPSGTRVHSTMLFVPDCCSVHVLLVHENRCEIKIQVYYTDKVSLNVLNLTYSSHPAQKMPQWNKDKCSPHYYNCTGDVVIPSVMRCNMVQECINNEDEAGCDYLHPDCGEWIPLQNICVKPLFLGTRVFCKEGAINHHPLGDRVQGEEKCKNIYGGRLAQLKNRQDVEFVGRIARQAGYRMLVTNIQKVQPVSKNLRQLYRYLWQWGDKGSPIAYDLHELQKEGMFLNCAMIVARSMTDIQAVPVPCILDDSFRVDGFVCMKPRHADPPIMEDAPRSVHLPRPSSHTMSDKFPTKICADGSHVQTFHPCYHEHKQSVSMASYSFSQFFCRFGPAVHYTLVCDGKEDCFDKSDEADCGAVTLPPLLNSMFTCKEFQLISKSRRCDGRYDCFDESDEMNCAGCQNVTQDVCATEGCLPLDYHFYTAICPPFYTFSRHFVMPSPFHVELDGYGMAELLVTSNSSKEFDFQCMDGNYVPYFLLNNGEQDCSSGEDENIPIENFTCPGLYRCHHSYSCVHPRHVCDEVYHCPHRDDERFCGIVCPDHCQCEGYAFHCTQFSYSPSLLLARYLDLSGSSNLSFTGIHFVELLQFFNLSDCGLRIVYFKSMPQLQILDLSFNEFQNVSSFVFEGLAGLKYLNISSNPITYVLDATFDSFTKTSALSNLRSLVMKYTNVHSIIDRAFNPLTQLEILDIRNNFLESYDREVFWGLDSLQELYTDDPRLCCPYFHESRVINCVAPSDELSSCSDLLRQNFLRVFLWLVALLALLGNVSVMLYRLFFAKQKTFSSFRVLVSNLCAADLFMGMYMTMIGIADLQFKGEYVANENVWKRSVVCKVAGFLGFVSSEASAMTVCLITLDRVLVLCFPLKSHVHLTARSCLAACGVLWFVAVTLAAVPLMAGLEFYGVSSICLPLPITRRQFSGQFYSFGVFIIFNFILFVFIGLGQIFIYRSILSASKVTSTDRRSQEMTIARRLFLVILSDFCCWFPVGLMGLLVAGGTPISEEINVWTAIFVLPLNSALNPFLYTLNSFLEKWRTEKLERQTKKFLGNIQTQLPKLRASTTEELLKICIRSNVVGRDKILQMLHVSQDSLLGD